ncbi:concanavalin A-like lectin/glucanase [Ascodesmis nigricans]|uniref:Concanavalin A-like lectin/glucanase n=1 Tax=Ascodesmis nigricans TaxID=341454 RepID=A0A4S2MRH7_9PEZI|nr:concanavalin A-like lectin/glucanase [Ascodesmis nigricans]
MDNGDHYTQRLYNNFAVFNDTTNDENLITTLADWYTMGWRHDGGSEYHAIPRQNERSNLWVKDGVLYMRQKGHSKGSEEPVSVAEINTRRSDILYGSFRIRNKAKGGSVAGFFVYYNDTQESDIELLTSGTTGSELLYTNHPAYDPKTNTIVPGTSFRHRVETPISEFQDHRLDWTPDATHFYHNNRLTRKIEVNVPSHVTTNIFPPPHRINIWANNGSWSGPPATKDVTMAIKSIRLYFNTTASNAGNDTEFNAACERVGGVGNGSAGEGQVSERESRESQAGG